MKEKTVSEAIHHRRSIRIYKADEEIDSDVVRACLKEASLAPNSSNMQLWEFYHITSPETLKKLTPLCLNQNAVKTAKELVIFVTRRDLWRKRVASNLKFIDTVYPKKSGKKMSSREKGARAYYGKLMPFAYASFFRIFGLVRFTISLVIGLFRPTYREVTESDIKAVGHKSTALAAQNFMMSMAGKGYDTCPLEGYDSWKVKRLLRIPRRAEITMMVSCGIREERGVYGERFRIPFEEVYKEV